MDTSDIRQLGPDWLTSPEWYPEQIDVPARHIRFCHMSRKSYQSSPFLDHRLVRLDAETAYLPMPDIGTLAVPAPRLPAHFIFHSAFCCSTLLSRHLEAASECLVLREPDCLYQVATLLRFRGRPPVHQLPEDEWNGVYRLITRLLARSDRPELPVLIKPSDGCNNLMTRLLASLSDSSAVFLYSSLERFLVAVLKLEQRHEWARIRIRELTLDLMNSGHGPVTDPSALNAAQTAALVWILQMRNARALRTMFGAARVAILHDETLVAQPAAAVARLLGHFGLAHDVSDVEAALGRGSGTRHSKADHVSYDANRREQDFESARAGTREQVMSGIAWARRVWGAENVESPFAHEYPA
jgi:hypothetical protein